MYHELHTIDKSTTRYVLGINRATIHNGPGYRSLILFKGCNMKCLWCSTPESQAFTPELGFYSRNCIECNYCIQDCKLNAINVSPINKIKIDRKVCNNCGDCVVRCYPEALKLMGQAMTVEEVLDVLLRDKIFYERTGGGVTLSGGEPLLCNIHYTVELCKRLKKENISIGVQTCGYVPFQNIEAVLPYIDFFCWDIKIMDSEKHMLYTGVSNELILENLLKVSEYGTPLYMRFPIIPGYTDSEENIRTICEFCTQLKSVKNLDILPVHHMGKIKYASLDRPYLINDVELIPNERMHNIRDIVCSYGFACKIGG